ncbi:MAG: electron transport complex subunit E [Bacteroidales bacterium]|nr:electron transport complex subunit E [Bacteroidales bacterium]
MNRWKIFSKGILKENPVLVLLLGLCPTLGVTTSAINGLGMGLMTAFVLVMTNSVISLIKNLVPNAVRIPVYITVIASLVTAVQLPFEASNSPLYDSLGLFIPLIAVNCIVLGRAEAFASKNTVFSSALDGMGMGLGFTLALTILGGIRELLGSGKLFEMVIYPESFGILAFVLAPGAFLVLAYLVVIMNKLLKKQ